MADLYPNLRFPQIDFSPLGNLPATMEEARQLRARRDTLADLSPDSGSAAYQKAAGRLMAAGDLEGGLKLMQQATALKGAEVREKVAGAPDLLTGFILKRLTEGPTPGGGTGGETATDLTSVPAAPTAAPPSPFPSAPMEPTTRVPPGLPIPGPQSALPNPEEAAPYRIAGPPQPPPAPPTGGMPLFQQSAQMPTPPSAPAEVPPAPPPTPGLSPEDQAGRNAKYWAATLAGMPHASPSQTQAIRGLFSNELDKTKLGPLEKEWNRYNFDQRSRGLPPLSFTDWKLDTESAKSDREKTLAAYEIYRGKAANARELDERLTRARTIMDNPRFNPGNPGYWDMGRNYAASTIESIYASLGVPVPPLVRQNLANLTEPVALREAFNAIMTGALTAYVSNRSFSDADRNALRDSLTNLGQTRGGAELVNKILLEMSGRTKQEEEGARKYLQTNRRVYPYGLEQAVIDSTTQKGTVTQKPILVNPDGSPTELGKEVQEKLRGPRSTGKIMGPGGKIFDSEEEAWADYNQQRR